MNASIIILSWNGLHYLEACLNAVLAQDYPDFEVIVVDNASSDGSADFVVANFPQIKLIRTGRNLGFAGGMNVGTRATAGDVVIWLNQDTVVQKNWLQNLLEAFAQSDVGVAGCKIFEADGVTLNHAGGALDVNLGESHHFGAGEIDRGQYDQPANVEYVTGAAMAVHRRVLEQVGMLDERFFPGYYEDADYCLRVRNAGYTIKYVPQAVVIHHISTSTHEQWYRRRFYYYRNRLLFVMKHLSVVDFQQKFLPEEQKKLQAAPFSELYAVQLALSDVIVRMEGQTLRDDLIALQNLVIWLRSAPSDNLTPVQNALNANRSNRQGAVGAIMPVLEEMETAWQIEDQPFRSTMPVLGAIIAAFRTAWNSISAKWYVLMLFKQQMKFNRLSRRAISAITAYVWDNDAALTLLEERCSQLEQRLAKLETAHRENREI